MRRLLMMVVLLTGCMDDVPHEVAECREYGQQCCVDVGYGGNSACILSFTQDCSPEDAEAARVACVTMHGLPRDAECRLVWR